MFADSMRLEHAAKVTKMKKDPVKTSLQFNWEPLKTELKEILAACNNCTCAMSVFLQSC